jgi:hypothetical protein
MLHPHTNACHDQGGAVFLEDLSYCGDKMSFVLNIFVSFIGMMCQRKRFQGHYNVCCNGEQL